MRPTADTLRYVALVLVVTVLGLFAVVFSGSPKAQVQDTDPNQLRMPYAGYSKGGVTVRDITTLNGTKCVVASQGDERGGVSISCDHSTRRPSP